MKILTTKSQLASGLKDIILYRLSTTLDDNSSCYVETYQNGRESGFKITTSIQTSRKFYTKVDDGLQPASLYETSTQRNVTITEYRNSDAIVIYHESNSNIGLSEEAYNTIKQFDSHDYSGVIEHCIAYLTKS